MTHFIRKQYMQVELKGSESEGFALQQKLQDIFYSKLQPAMEAALDVCSSPGKLLVIDHLEIDAGTIDLNRIEEELATKVADALIKSIEKDAFSKSSVNKDNDTSFYRTENENVWEAFIYFLHNGYLPWSYILPEGKNLEEVLAEILLEDGAEFLSIIPLARIRDVLSAISAAKRLLLQFSESFIRMLLEKVVPGIVKEIDSLLFQTDHIAISPEDAKFVRKLILEKTLILISKDYKFSKDEIEKLVLLELRSRTELFLQVSKAFENTWLQVKPIDSKQNTVITDKTGEINRDETRDGIYIDNAGLVLLHPFLPLFFESLGIEKDSVIVQPEKALALLHYLASGQTGTPEYEMVLSKILCNIPLSVSIPAKVEISGNETEEASALLDAVIKHWEALRNTSQDGLRGSFLLRPGKLTLKEDGDWLLQVEPRTFDILLNHLPWGISIIKLPWMEKMVWVEWRE